MNPSLKTAYESLRHVYGQYLLGHEKLLELLLVAYFSRGHVLLEGPPGTGKTITAKLLSKLLAKDFKRIQFTSDLLPADILGSNLYRPDAHSFEFIRGPIFSDFLLADEINRTPPRTQSALLEAMEEGQVTIEGQTLKLSADFFVMATQNPQDYEGTFPLPEVQLDRFLFKIVLGHADSSLESKVLRNILSGFLSPAFEGVEAISFSRSEIDAEIKAVRVDDALLTYISKLIEKTRHHPMIAQGSSIRGAIALAKTSRVLALLSGRDFVIPDDIKRLALPVLRHRIALRSESLIARVSEERVIESILKEIEFPE